MDKSPYKTTGSKIVYENPWIKVREDSIVRPDGQPGIYGVVETRDSVIILAVNEKQEICLVHVFRYAVDQWSFELPGGGGDNQDPIQSAMRELVEETGIVASDYHHIGSLHLHGVLSEKMHIVVMRQLRQTGENHQLEEGIDAMGFQSMESIEQLIANGGINDAQTIAAIHVYNCWLKQQQSAI